MFRNQFSSFMTALIVLNLAFNFLTIGSVPSFISEDDGGYAQASYYFYKSLTPHIPSWGSFLHFDNVVWPFGRIFSLVQGFFLHYFKVSIFYALLPSFLTGALLIYILYLFGKELWDKDSALISAFLLSLSPKFFLTTHGARPDLLVALLFMVSLYFILKGVNAGKSYLIFLSGFLTGLSGDVHPNGFVLTPLPLLFFLLLSKEEGFPWKKKRLIHAVLLFSFGVLIAFLYWLATHILPFKNFIWDQIKILGIKSHGLKIYKLGVWNSFASEFNRYINWFWRAKYHRFFYEGVCFVSAFITLLVLGEVREKSLALIWPAFFILSAFFFSNPFGWYLIYIWPILIITVVRAYQLVRRFKISKVFLVTLIALFYLNNVFWLYKYSKDVTFQETCNTVRQLVPKNATVLGPDPFWFAFYDRNFVSTWYLSFKAKDLNLRSDPKSIYSFLEKEKKKWDFIVAYQDLADFLDTSVPISHFGRKYKNRMNTILAWRKLSQKYLEQVKVISAGSYRVLLFKVKK